MHRKTRVRPLSVVLTFPFIMLACSDDESPTALDFARGGPTLTAAQAKDTDALRQELTQILDDVNRRLSRGRADVRVAAITTIGTPEAQGITVLWRDIGNKHIGVDFVPGDPRRAAGSPEGGWSPDPNEILFAIDTGDGTTLNGVGSAATTQQIREAMATWDAERCSNLNLTEVPAGGDLGFLAALLAAGGSFNVVADIQHAGWLELESGATTIAFTAPFIWVDGATGVPTDIDGNRELDYAFAEIYYDAFCQGCAVPGPWIWTVDDDTNTPGVLDIDIQSVALHEAGHGLSQAHFGKGFLTDSNGKLHLSPNSVMKAAYVAPIHELHGSDNGGHCSLWGSWPNN